MHKKLEAKLGELHFALSLVHKPAQPIPGAGPTGIADGLLVDLGPPMSQEALRYYVHNFVGLIGMLREHLVECLIASKGVPSKAAVQQVRDFLLANRGAAIVHDLSNRIKHPGTPRELLTGMELALTDYRQDTRVHIGDQPRSPASLETGPTDRQQIVRGGVAAEAIIHATVVEVPTGKPVGRLYTFAEQALDAWHKEIVSAGFGACLP